jgi:predicted permease
VRSGDLTQPGQVALVTGNYFSMLGARAQRGRLLGGRDDAANEPPVVVVSDRFWRNHLGTDPHIIGRTIFVSDAPLTIVGITAPEFRGTDLVDVPDMWVPVSVWPLVRTSAFAALGIDQEGWGWLTAIGRMRPGVTLAVAQSTARATAAREIQRYPKLARLYSSLELFPAAQTVAGDAHVTVAQFAAILMAAVVTLLLIACANVAMLLAARAADRRGEIAVRLALGASRSRLVRQLVGECLLLGGFAAALALLFTWIAITLVDRITLPGGIELAHLNAHIGPSVLLATAMAAGLAVLVIGVGPAVLATRRVELATRSHRGVSTDRTHTRFRDVLLVAEVALSLVLLVGAGLFTRGLRRALASDLGFRPDHLAVASTNTGLVRFDTLRAERYYAEARQAVATLPGVRDVSVSVAIPLSDHDVLDGTVEGYVPATGRPKEEFTVDIVDPGYVRTVGAALVAGREFTEADRDNAGLVALVNQAFVRHYWPDADPIGKRITLTLPATVVGVVRDIKTERLDESPVPVAYFPIAQQPHWYLDRVHFIVRTSGDPEASLAAIRRVLLQVNPHVPVENLATFGTVLSTVLLPQHLLAGVLTAFSMVAIVVSVVGMYGVLAYLVSRRTKEIGIRLALGARQSAVVSLVIGHNLRRVALGIVVGSVAALLVTPATASLLYGVSTTDIWAYAPTVVLLLFVGVVAAYLPARRAAAIEPVEVLRSD